MARHVEADDARQGRPDSGGTGQMTDPIDALWDRYRQTGDPEARMQLLDRYLGLVHHGAHQLAQGLSRHVEIDELIGAGTFGLVQALEGYDPDRGRAFGTYAMPRIRGAMLDELHAWDREPRSDPGQPLDEGRDESGDGAPRAGRSHGAPLPSNSGDAGGAVNDAVEGVDPAGSLDRLRGVFERLGGRDRLVLSLDRYEELSPRQIGEILHCSESRISQIRARALWRLRVALVRSEAA